MKPVSWLGVVVVSEYSVMITLCALETPLTHIASVTVCSRRSNSQVGLSHSAGRLHSLAMTIIYSSLTASVPIGMTYSYLMVTQLLGSSLNRVLGSGPLSLSALEVAAKSFCRLSSPKARLTLLVSTSKCRVFRQIGISQSQTMAGQPMSLALWGSRGCLTSMQGHRHHHLGVCSSSMATDHTQVLNSWMLCGNAILFCSCSWRIPRT